MTRNITVVVGYAETRQLGAHCSNFRTGLSGIDAADKKSSGKHSPQRGAMDARGWR